MNGQIPPPAPDSSGTAASCPHRVLAPAPASTRLFVALLASCSLHAAAVILPYLGSGGGKDQRTMPGGKQKALRGFTVTLASTAKAPFVIAESPKQEGRYPDASSPARNPTGESPLPQELGEGVGLLPIPAPTYYSAEQLTKRPQPLTEASLDTPEISQIIASGKIVLKLWINDLGEVVDVETEKSELPEAFSRTAIAVFRQIRFAAGELHGQPVGSVMRIEISYVDGRLPPP
ncbi:MAG: hypothetical protein WC073_07000 [Sterolibacterium sp.]